MNFVNGSKVILNSSYISVNSCKRKNKKLSLTRVVSVVKIVFENFYDVPKSSSTNVLLPPNPSALELEGFFHRFFLQHSFPLRQINVACWLQSWIHAVATVISVGAQGAKGLR